jgi:DNA repair protein RadD
MLYLIEKGFLCPLVTPTVNTVMDVSGVKTRNGDYMEGQLQSAVDKDPITKACVDEIIAHGQDRKKWLIFTAGVEHCKHVRDEIRSRGISCEMVIGSTPVGERNEIVDGHKNGTLRCLVNVGCFTTGFNNPAIDLMAFMRPTRSPVLYVQMGGRGMRTSNGKTDCCLLDFGGVIKELGPLDLIDAHRVSSSKGSGEAPVKLCPKCQAVCFAGASECQDCGYLFPDNPIDLSKKPSTLGVLSNQVEPEWHDVLSVSYKRHEKPGKAASMVVTYATLDGPYKEWICYEHTGYARERACKWHRDRSDRPAPNKVDEALLMDFREPTRISERQAGKFHEICGYDFESLKVTDSQTVPF